MTPLISYIIASRNDQYCGDSLQRLQSTVHKLLPQIGEIIIVDWGSDNPISHEARFHFVNLKFIYVPQEITQRYTTPFHETLALNIGIRRASGHFIARLDQDILCGDPWFDFVSKLDPSHSYPAYFSSRRVCIVPRFIAPYGTTFYRAAVGILLAERKAWHDLRGYDERMLHRNHMEHGLCMRFKRHCGLLNLGTMLGFPFYHQWHEVVQDREENPMPSLDYLSTVPIQANDQNWGLGNLTLEGE